MGDVVKFGRVRFRIKELEVVDTRPMNSAWQQLKKKNAEEFKRMKENSERVQAVS